MPDPFYAFGINADSGVSGYDLKSDLYYTAAHLRQLIDEVTVNKNVNENLTIEQARKVFERYNGSGPLAQKYSNDAINALQDAANGSSTLYWFEK